MLRRSRRVGQCLAHVPMDFKQMEVELLSDGREYLLNTTEPTMADIHCIWTFDWAPQGEMYMFEDLEKDLISDEQFPKTFAYVSRFRRALAGKQEENGKPEELSAEQAIERIMVSDFSEREGSIDPSDPLRLKKGQMVGVWPIDSGFTHHDKGNLVSNGLKDVVVSSKPNVGEASLRFPFPRVYFRVQPLAGSRL